MLDFLKNFTNKSIIHVNILRHKRIKEMKHYIYKDDIIIGLNYKFNENNWTYFDEKIINKFINNTILLFHSNEQNILGNKVHDKYLKNKSNIKIFVNN